MRRLPVRLLLSHAAVALLGALASWLVVWSVAPTLFEREMRQGPRGQGPGGGLGPGRVVRDQFVAAVQQSTFWGALVGMLAAVVLAIVLTRVLVGPLRQLQRATRAIAAGHYETPVVRGGTEEFHALAEDVGTLASRLRETEQRRVRLLGEVAHEMRTPLTVIDGLVEGMIDGLVPPSPEELGQVSEEVRRLRRLSDDLSLLSRAEEGRLSMQPLPLELGEVVRAVAERMRPQFEDAGVTLEVEVDQPAPALADADRIGQVVTNLLGNALRATPAGGRVRIATATVGDRAQIIVRDTGEGLAPDQLERIFERFYRVPDRRQGAETGSGIGLTISRRIARAHGGDLVASSPGRGQGASFTVSVPRP